MLLFFVIEGDLYELGKTVNEHFDSRSELFSDSFKRNRAVLDRIVKKSGADRVCVKTERINYLSDGDGVDNIRLAAYTVLSAVELFRKNICFFNFWNIIFGWIFIKESFQTAEIVARLLHCIDIIIHNTDFPFKKGMFRGFTGKYYCFSASERIFT